MLHILLFGGIILWWLYNVTYLRYKKFMPCLTQVLLLRLNGMRFVEETIELLWNNYCCISTIVCNMYKVVIYIDTLISFLKAFRGYFYIDGYRCNKTGFKIARNLITLKRYF